MLEDSEGDVEVSASTIAISICTKKKTSCWHVLAQIS